MVAGELQVTRPQVLVCLGATDAKASSAENSASPGNAAHPGPRWYWQRCTPRPFSARPTTMPATKPTRSLSRICLSFESSYDPKSPIRLTPFDLFAPFIVFAFSSAIRIRPPHSSFSIRRSSFHEHYLAKPRRCARCHLQAVAIVSRMSVYFAFQPKARSAARASA